MTDFSNVIMTYKTLFTNIYTPDTWSTSLKARINVPTRGKMKPSLKPVLHQTNVFARDFFLCRQRWSRQQKRCRQS